MERRLALKLTQQEVADLAEVGLSSIRALEQGRDTLTLAVTLRILGTLGLSLAVPTSHGNATPVRGTG